MTSYFYVVTYVKRFGIESHFGVRINAMLNLAKLRDVFHRVQW